MVTMNKLYTVDSSLLNNYRHLVYIQPLKYGSKVLIIGNSFINISALFNVYKIPYFCEEAIGYYDSKLKWQVKSNPPITIKNISYWLKTQSNRYAQRRLLKIL